MKLGMKFTSINIWDSNQKSSFSSLKLTWCRKPIKIKANRMNCMEFCGIFLRYISRITTYNRFEYLFIEMSLCIFLVHKFYKINNHHRIYLFEKKKMIHKKILFQFHWKTNHAKLDHIVSGWVQIKSKHWY